MDRRSFLATLPAASAAGVWARVADAAADDFASWLGELRREAGRRGVSSRTLNDALAEATLLPRVLELDRQQPEFKLTFDEYLAKVVPDSRVDTGQARLRDNASVLNQVSQRFGVPARIMVAFWGIESDYGRITGNFGVIPALATLAYDGRRSSFFREELLKALTIIDRGHIGARDMRGSWAGAMGQPQFMPSSFLAYAVDFDGDGRANIWSSRADVFASIANYLARSGWKTGETWGRAVRVPTGIDSSLIDYRRVQKPLGEWHRLGVRRTDGGDLPGRDVSAGLVQPGGAGGPSFLVYQNYRAILRYNPSVFYAIAVGLLSDRIGDG